MPATLNEITNSSIEKSQALIKEECELIANICKDTNLTYLEAPSVSNKRYSGRYLILDADDNLIGICITQEYWIKNAIAYAQGKPLDEQVRLDFKFNKALIKSANEFIADGYHYRSEIIKLMVDGMTYEQAIADEKLRMIELASQHGVEVARFNKFGRQVYLAIYQRDIVGYCAGSGNGICTMIGDVFEGNTDDMLDSLDNINSKYYGKEFIKAAYEFAKNYTF